MIVKTNWPLRTGDRVAGEIAVTRGFVEVIVSAELGSSLKITVVSLLTRLLRRVPVAGALLIMLNYIAVPVSTGLAKPSIVHTICVGVLDETVQ